MLVNIFQIKYLFIIMDINIIIITVIIGGCITIKYIYKFIKSKYERHKLQRSVHPFYKKRSSRIFIK